MYKRFILLFYLFFSVFINYTNLHALKYQSYILLETKPGEKISKISWHPTNPNVIAVAFDSYEIKKDYYKYKRPYWIVKIFNIKNNKTILTLPKFSFPITRLQWHQSKPNILAIIEERPFGFEKLTIWKTNLNRPLTIFGNNPLLYKKNFMSWSIVNPNIIATAESYLGSTIWIWNIAKEKWIKNINTNKKYCTCALWHPKKNNILAITYLDGTILIINTKTGKIINTLNGHSKKIITAQFNHINFNLLATSSEDKTIKIWNWTTEECIQNLSNINYENCDILSWHPKNPDILLMCFSSNENQKDSELIFYNIQTKEQIKIKTPYVIESLSWNPQDPSLIVLSIKHHMEDIYKILMWKTFQSKINFTDFFDCTIECEN
ncbi:hypothetical protein KAT08_00780 [Candidatus Babeliales bacterium]|nr:hypothetical protein [Candidatus Babeliales bacterium]